MTWSIFTFILRVKRKGEKSGISERRWENIINVGVKEAACV
jgi:hypothetical protein